MKKLQSVQFQGTYRKRMNCHPFWGTIHAEPRVKLPNDVTYMLSLKSDTERFHTETLSYDQIEQVMIQLPEALIIGPKLAESLSQIE